MVLNAAALDNGQSIFCRENPIANDNGSDIANPCHSSSGMETPHRAPATVTAPSLDEKWYLMRAAYGQEKKAYEYLVGREDIADVFYPQWYKERSYGGKKKRVLVSIIPNTLFVRSTQASLKKYIGTPPLVFFHHYYQRYRDEQQNDIGSGRKPITIPDSQIVTFRKWLDAEAEDKIFINDSFTFKKNDVVRVKEGAFEGFTGHIVRLKGQTRVGVNIDGVGFISTTYIPKNCLEKINQ